jgi:broad specificity phosphatase PhoE
MIDFMKRIVLVRHGRPVAATNPWLNARGFAQWLRRYNKSAIDEAQTAPPDLRFNDDRYLVVSSGMLRAIQSTRLCLGRDPDLTIEALREMDIPRYRMPVCMPAYCWVVLNRAAWMLGIDGRTETYRAAKTRAAHVAAQLHELSWTHDRIIVFGHGMMSFHIGKGLRGIGWRGHVKPLRYWDAIYLERPV